MTIRPALSVELFLCLNNCKMISMSGFGQLLGCQTTMESILLLVLLWRDDGKETSNHQVYINFREIWCFRLVGVGVDCKWKWNTVLISTFHTLCFFRWVFRFCNILFYWVVLIGVIGCVWMYSKMKFGYDGVLIYIIMWFITLHLKWLEVPTFEKYCQIGSYCVWCVPGYEGCFWACWGEAQILRFVANPVFSKEIVLLDIVEICFRFSTLAREIIAPNDENLNCAKHQSYQYVRKLFCIALH